MSVRAAILVVMVFGTLGCKDSQPTQIQGGQLPPMLGAAPVPISARLANKAGEPVEGPLSFNVVPADIATVSAGTLTCAKTGDATVVIAGGGLSVSKPLKCRVVHELELPSEMELILGNAPSPLPLKVLDEAGRPLSEASGVTIAAANPSVVRTSGFRLEPLMVGATKITATAGAVSTSTEIRVIKKAKVDSLNLGDGASVTYTLNQGKYVVEVTVRASDGSGYGVVVRWVGANCAASAEAQKHRVTCEVENTASLVVENPTTFGMGPSEQGNLVVYQTP